MGRWLKKLEGMSITEPTKLTQHTYVGFVSTGSRHLHKNITEKGLIDVIKKCCDGLPVDAQQVIDGLLSLDDEQDIIDGNTPVESLRLHIELWIKAGKPHYSGKELG